MIYFNVPLVGIGPESCVSDSAVLILCTQNYLQLVEKLKLQRMIKAPM